MKGLHLSLTDKTSFVSSSRPLIQRSFGSVLAFVDSVCVDTCARMCVKWGGINCQTLGKEVSILWLRSQ